MNRPAGLRTWIEIDRQALKHNYQAFRGLIGRKTKLLAVAKSNAYGHNLTEFSLSLAEFGADWIGVDSIVEAKTLRENGLNIPILVLGYTLPEKMSQALRFNISLTASHPEQLKSLARLKAAKPKIHLKIDTGLHRQGFLPEEVSDIIKYIDKELGKDSIEGIYTHFAAAKDPQNIKPTIKQAQVFEKVLKNFRQSGYQFLVHASATGGTILFPQAHYDLVRVGIGLYGHYPSSEIEQTYSKQLNLNPALTWKTIIGEIKELPQGSRVGYDLTEKLNRQSRLAVCPVGYWHGLPRNLSSKAYVLVGGKRCKVLGRISMDMITIDVTGVPEAKINDEVVLIGRQGKEIISAEETAKLSNSTNYEILTRLNPLIKRIYI